MKMHDTKSALKVCYYFMAVDGSIDEDELERFCEAGEELDRKNFDSYKNEIVEECKKQIDSADTDGDYYDIIQEGVDAVLFQEPKSDDKGVTSRLLIWDLFAIAFSNNDYNAAEKRLIEHIARVSGIEKNVIMEMEQMMQTAMSVQCEMTWIQQLSKPYYEVRPIVDELENRIRVISDAAKALIEDEAAVDYPYEDEPDFFDKARCAIDGTMSPVLHTMGDVARDAGKKAKNAGGSVADAVSDAWKGLLSKKKTQAHSINEKEDN